MKCGFPGPKTAMSKPKTFCQELVIVSGVLIGLMTALFPEAFIHHKTLLPADLLYFYSPWRELYPNLFSQPSNWILYDEILEFAPWREFTKQQLLAGNLPLWDPHCFGGYPFVGVLQTAVFYPLDLLLLPLSQAIYPTIRGLIHVLVAGLGMFYFLRRWPLPFELAAAASALYPFCGFMVVWFGHPHFKVAAWLPLLLGLTRNLVNKPTLSGTLAFTLVLSLQYLAGHVETSVHVLFAVVLSAACYLATKRDNLLRFLVAFLAANGLALGLASLQLAPFAEYLLNSAAYAVRKHGVWVQPYFPPEIAICLTQPKFFGCNADNNYWYPEFNSNEVMAGYIGILPLLFGLAGVRFRRRDPNALTLSVMAVFGLAVVFRAPPFYQALHLIPGMKMSYNFRFLLLTSFALSALAAKSLQSLIERTSRMGRLLVIWGLCLLANTAMFLWYPRPYANNHLLAYTREHFSLFLVFWALTPAVVVLFRTRRVRPYFLAAAYTAVAFADLWLVGRNYNRAYEPELLFPSELVSQWVPSASPPTRLLPLGFTFPPHTSTLLGFHDIRGNDALTPLGIEDYLAALDPAIRGPKVLPAMRLIQYQRFAHPMIDALNVTHLLTPQGTGLEHWLGPTDSYRPEDYPIVKQEHGLTLFRNTKAYPRSYFIGQYEAVTNPEAAMGILAQAAKHRVMTWVIEHPEPASFNPKSASAPAPQPVKILTYSNHRIELSADVSEPGLLVLADTYFPGWRATVNGVDHDVKRLNRALRAVPVQPGINQVVFRYVPASFRLGLFLTCLTAMILTLLAGYRFFI